jgi:hypothetical protein
MNDEKNKLKELKERIEQDKKLPETSKEAFKQLIKEVEKGGKK